MFSAMNLPFLRRLFLLCTLLGHGLALRHTMTVRILDDKPPEITDAANCTKIGGQETSANSCLCLPHFNVFYGSSPSCRRAIFVIRMNSTEAGIDFANLDVSAFLPCFASSPPQKPRFSNIFVWNINDEAGGVWIDVTGNFSFIRFGLVSSEERNQVTLAVRRLADEQWQGHLFLIQFSCGDELLLSFKGARTYPWRSLLFEEPTVAPAISKPRRQSSTLVSTDYPKSTLPSAGRLSKDAIVGVSIGGGVLILLILFICTCGVVRRPRPVEMSSLNDGLGVEKQYALLTSLQHGDVYESLSRGTEDNMYATVTVGIRDSGPKDAVAAAPSYMELDPDYIKTSAELHLNKAF